jgi:hypothetical protein
MPPEDSREDSMKLLFGSVKDMHSIAARLQFRPDGPTMGKAIDALKALQKLLEFLDSSTTGVGLTVNQPDMPKDIDRMDHRVVKAKALSSVVSGCMRLILKEHNLSSNIPEPLKSEAYHIFNTATAALLTKLQKLYPNDAHVSNSEEPKPAYILSYEELDQFQAFLKMKVEGQPTTSETHSSTIESTHLSLP